MQKYIIRHISAVKSALNAFLACICYPAKTTFWITIEINFTLQGIRNPEESYPLCTKVSFSLLFFCSLKKHHKILISKLDNILFGKNLSVIFK